jgi:hypothetical protein
MSANTKKTGKSSLRVFGVSLRLVGALVWLGLLLGYLTFPKLVPYLIEDILDENEVDLISADFGRPTYSGITANNVYLKSRRGDTVEFGELRVSYHPFELLNGVLQQLHVSNARIVMSRELEQSSGANPDGTSKWPQIEELLEKLPVREIIVGSLRVETTEETLNLTAFLRSDSGSFAHRVSINSSSFGHLLLEGGPVPGKVFSSSLSIDGVTLGSLSLSYPKDETRVIDGELRLAFAYSSIRHRFPNVEQVEDANIRLFIRGSLLRMKGADFVSALSLTTDFEGSELRLSRIPESLRPSSVWGKGEIVNAVIKQQILVSPASTPIVAIASLNHKLSDSSGSIALSIDANAKDIGNLINRASLVPLSEYRIKSGEVKARSHLTWGDTISPWRLTLGFSGLGLESPGLSVSGASGDLRWVSTSANHLNADLRIANLNTGVKLSDLNARLKVKDLSSAKTIFVDDVRANILGGSLRAQNFVIPSDASVPSSFRLELNRLQLGEIASQLAQEKLEMQGLLSGFLPIDYIAGELSISRGELKSSGGRIRYLGLPKLGNASLANALGILEDYRFDDLAVLLNYKPDGTLLLNSSLKGRNPNYQAGRQVNFSLNIEENVIKLLQSLRLSERLEKSIENNIK